MAERYPDPDVVTRPAARPLPPAEGVTAEARHYDARSAALNQPREISGVRTRQGGLGRPVLWVLVVGLALAAIYLIGTQVWSTSEDLPPAGQVENAAPTPGDVNDPLLGPRADPVPPAAMAPLNLAPGAPAITPAPLTPAPVTPEPLTPAPVQP